MSVFSKKLISLVLPIVLIVGCRDQRPGEHETDHDREEAVSYSEKSGLSIPQKTAEYIGLRVAEVGENQVGAEIKFTAQVYETESAILASGVVGSADAASLRPDQPATAEWNGNKIAARIKELNRQLEKSNRQVEVLVAIDDTSKTLPQSAFVSVAVPIAATGSDTITVPRTALLKTVEGDFIYTVSGDKFVRAPVKLGVVDDDFVEVLDGLYAGDRIVVNPVMTLWLTELQFIRGGKSCADGH